MKITAAIAKTIKFVVVTLSSLSVGLAAVVALSPGSPSMAKYVLEPLSYSITMESYDAISLVSLGAITGVERVGQTLTSGALTPSGAAATYQWQRSASAGGPYSDISGATSSTYTLTPGDHNYYIRLAATGTGNYIGTVYSPYKGPVEPKIIDISAIPGVTPPATNAIPVTTITPTDQYTGTVSWNGTLNSGRFRSTSTYTATITLTPKAGYTLTGVPQNFFTVAGTTSTTNAANSGVVSAAFPRTDRSKVTDIANITGTVKVGSVLTAGARTPANATVSYQWQRSDSENGTYTNISGATAISYTPVPGDFGYYIRVTASGTGSWYGTVTSAPVGPVAAKTVSIAAIPGVTAPATGEEPVTSLAATAQYTLGIEWSPLVVQGVFEGEVIYTATITVTPKNGYTLQGVPEDFFSVAGVSYIANAENSGVITAEFPETEPDAGQAKFEGSFFGDLFKMFFGGKAPEGTPAPLPTIEAPDGEDAVTDGADRTDDAEDAENPAEEEAEPAEGEQEDENADGEEQPPESDDADNGEAPAGQDEPNGLDNDGAVDENDENGDKTQAAPDETGDAERDAPVEIPLPPEEDALPAEDPDDLPPDDGGGGDAGGADGGDDGQPQDADGLD